MADANGWSSPQAAKQQDAMSALAEQIDRVGVLREIAEKRLMNADIEHGHAKREVQLLSAMQEALATVRMKFQETADEPRAERAYR